MSKDSYNKMINNKESLLLVIDLQEKFVPYLKHKSRVIKSTQLLLNVAKQLNIPVIVTEHNPEKIGPTIEEIKSYLDNVSNKKFFRKDIFSCCGDETIKKAILSNKSIKNIIVVGCETHICVMQTTIDALNLGFNVHVVADAVSSRFEIDWELGLKRIENSGANLVTSEMIAYEFLGRSDIVDFKALLPVFKQWTEREKE